jgi:16S rRNA processing protein RimM
VRLVVALVRGFRGLRGQVRVELLTDRPEDRLLAGARLYLEGTDEILTIDEASPVADGRGWWLRFREIADRNGAERLRDLYLEIDAPDEPRVPGRWFFHELEGLAVRSRSGEDLGIVVEVYRAGGAEVFVVRGARGELDVPAVRGIVIDLAPERGEMIVDMDALALDARPVEDEDYVRPRDRRPKKQPKPKGPSQPKGPTTPAKGRTRAQTPGAPTSPRAASPRPAGVQESEPLAAADPVPAPPDPVLAPGRAPSAASDPDDGAATG